MKVTFFSSKVKRLHLFKWFVLTFLFLLTCIPLSLHSQTVAGKPVTVEFKDATFDQFISVLQEQTGYKFEFKKDEVKQLNNITVKATNEKVGDLLDRVLDSKFTGLVFSIKGNSIVIQKDPNFKGQQVRTDVYGVVTDEQGTPIPWVNVQLVGTKFGGTTNEEGEFKFTVQGDPTGKTIQCSCIGMETGTAIFRPGVRTNIVLKDASLELDQVVVTGIFERERKNFTGSAKTYTSEELKMIGNQNVLTSLKTLDPNFAILESNEFGSDPNRLADIEIRGKTSVIGLSQEYGTDPNQPLFILDGFESSLRTISDLSMDRVESITLLKDASATAIYGSKAANGVVVVETKRPKSGKLALNYSANLKLNYADLSDFNLMNATEKLQFEKLSGEYGDLDIDGNVTDESSASLYNHRLAEVKRGVDTYWMADPLRYGLTQSHNLFAEGGDDKMRYGIGFSYSGTEGVMKGSNRDVLNGSIRLIYRWKNLTFTESMNIDNTKSTREMVPFHEYSKTNPYYRKHNADGEPTKILETSTSFSSTNYIYNPLYNAGLNNFNTSDGTSFRNNFEAEWRPLSEIRVRGRFGLISGRTEDITFISPLHTNFESTAPTRKGTFDQGNSDMQSMNGDFSVTFGKLLAEKYMVNAVAGMSMSSSESTSGGYNVSGFIDESKANPAFSNGFTQNSRPIYRTSESRAVSYFFNAGFSAFSKYLMDVSLRSDGSSIFGVDNKFTTTWSVGLGWNVSEESFIKNLGFIDFFKIRGSIGNPGNQNFNAGMVFNTYTYNADYINLFGLSSYISSFGNKGLKWQKTLDANFGVDLELLDRRLRLNFETFRKETDPLLVNISVPASTGTRQVPYNAGGSLSRGYSFLASYTLIRKGGINWQAHTNGRFTSSKYQNIGNLLDSFNKGNISSRDLTRYYDGGSTSDLWAVRSAGIDPATGREIYIKKDGTQTFKFDFDDEVIVGNTNPDIDGIIGTTFYYNKFSVSLNMRYRLGGDTFLHSLFNKVENISRSSVRYNQDKRALYDRWQKPGDNAKYKAISLTEQTQITSRFVVKENTFAGESISMGYQTGSKKLAAVGISSLNFRVYMNDIFRISTVKNERGTSYPFERSVSFSVGLRFL